MYVSVHKYDISHTYTHTQILRTIKWFPYVGKAEIWKLDDACSIFLFSALSVMYCNNLYKSPRLLVLYSPLNKSKNEDSFMC